jgi:hypothetical protein
MRALRARKHVTDMRQLHCALASAQCTVRAMLVTCTYERAMLRAMRLRARNARDMRLRDRTHIGQTQWNVHSRMPSIHQITP